jgi:hypothetical protein
VLGTVPSREVLKIVRDWDVLRLDCSQEVLHDRISVIAKGHLDWAVEAMDVPIITGPLVRLMFPHERNQLFSSPSFGLLQTTHQLSHWT